MFDISTKWQEGAISSLAYLAIILGVLWILSKIELKDKESNK
jgi:hypothetical protein